MWEGRGHMVAGCVLYRSYDHSIEGARLGQRSTIILQQEPSLLSSVGFAPEALCFWRFVNSGTTSRVERGGWSKQQGPRLSAQGFEERLWLCDWEYFEEGRAWVVYAAMVAARDSPGKRWWSCRIYWGGLVGGLYPCTRDRLLAIATCQARFGRTGMSFLRRAVCLVAQMEALGKHFQAVRVVALP